MANDYSADELQGFLTYAIQKGLIKEVTGKSRRIAAQKVLSALDESEREDLRGIDVNAVFDRFVNKFSRDFTPESLATYKSRFQLALNDFLRYKENPAGFRFDGHRKARPSGDGAEGEKRGTVKRILRTQPSAGRAPPPVATPPAPTVSEVVFPIPIREGVIVRLHNIPNNMTKAEAQRISAVILALAMD